MLRPNVALTVLCFGLLAACGGGGGGGSSGASFPTLTNAYGIWVGSSTSGGMSIQIEGVIARGESRFVDENGTQYIVTGISGFDGEIRIDFNAYAQFGYVFLDGSTSGTGTITGVVRERTSINGNFSFSTGEAGTISFTYDALYDRDSSLEKLTGQWNDEFGVMTVDPDGSFFEQDQFGCIYDGQASIIDVAYNAYRLAMTVSNCGADNGSYEGLAVLSDLVTADDEDLLIVQMNSNSLIFTTFLERL